MKIPFFHKYYSGSYIGGILETYSRSASIISAVQFFVVLIILYTTSAKPIISEYLPWLSFGLYLTVAAVGIMVLMTLVRILVIPSAYTFFSKQLWNNNNPMRTKLEAIEANQKKIMKKLGIPTEVDTPEGY